MKIQRFQKILNHLSIAHKVILAEDETVDDMIQLQGELKDIHISIGADYYSVVKQIDDTFNSIEGKGRLPDEIKKARSL